MNQAIRTSSVLIAIAAALSLLLVLVFIANGLVYVLLPLWLTALFFGLSILVDRLIPKMSVQVTAKLLVWAALTAALVYLAT